MLIRNYYEREDWSGLRQWLRGQRDNPESYLTPNTFGYLFYRCDYHESLQENGPTIDTTMINARWVMVDLAKARELDTDLFLDRIWITSVIDRLNYYNQPTMAAELLSELRSVTGGDSEPDQPSPSAISVATGTGFFVSSDGKIVTAYHVVEDADTISVTTSSGRVETATLVHFSRAADIAFLKADVSDQEFITFSKSNPPSSGTSVFTIGFPVKQVLGDEPKFSDGAISAMSGLGGDSTLMQITIPIQPGNSGGPVVTESGEVVGVVTSSASILQFAKTSGTLPQNVNWAVKSEYAQMLLGELGTHLAVTRDAAIERTRRAVCAITASKK